MSNEDIPRWLVWARELQAIAQTGLNYSQDEYHQARFARVLEISAEIVADYTNLPEKSIHEDFLAQKGYATPKIDVRGAVIQEGKILLVRDAVDGCWCMPGGWADLGEAPSKMVEREVWEESGFETRAAKLVGIFEGNRDRPPLALYHVYKLVFLCEMIGGEARVSLETSAVEFFDPERLPPLSQSRTNARHLKEVFEHVKNPDRLPHFD